MNPIIYGVKTKQIMNEWLLCFLQKRYLAEVDGSTLWLFIGKKEKYY